MQAQLDREEIQVRLDHLVPQAVLDLQVKGDLRVQRVHREVVVMQEPQAVLVRLEYKDLLDQQVLQVFQARQVRLVSLVQRASVETLEREAHQDQTAIRVMLEVRVLLDLPVISDQWVHQVLQVQEERQDRQVVQDRQESQDRLEMLERQDHLVPQDREEIWEHQALQELKGLKDKRVPGVMLVLQDLQAVQVQTETLA